MQTAYFIIYANEYDEELTLWADEFLKDDRIWEVFWYYSVGTTVEKIGTAGRIAP